jgi:hypothetical protein
MTSEATGFVIKIVELDHDFMVRSEVVRERFDSELGSLRFSEPLSQQLDVPVAFFPVLLVVLGVTDLNTILVAGRRTET